MSVDVKEVLARYRKGRSYNEIATDLGTTKGVVAGIIYRNKTNSPKLSFEERMKKHGVS